VIDAEFGRMNTVRFPATAMGEGWNHLMSELTADQIQRMVKVTKKIYFFKGDVRTDGFL
jgi:hypothetical protein